jgi:hypothetical protein
MYTAILVLAFVATAQAMSPERISSAIEHGRRIKGPTYILMGGIHAPHFRVEVTGPFGRIATAAADAERLYRPFTPADVTPEMTADTFTITVRPGKPEQWREAPAITHVVVRLPDGRVIQPVALEPFTQTWPDQEYTQGALRATFPREDLLSGREVAVVVISETKERSYKLKRADLDKVR